MGRRAGRAEAEALPGRLPHRGGGGRCRVVAGWVLDTVTLGCPLSCLPRCPIRVWSSSPLRLQPRDPQMPSPAPDPEKPSSCPYSASLLGSKRQRWGACLQRSSLLGGHRGFLRPWKEIPMHLVGGLCGALAHYLPSKELRSGNRVTSLLTSPRLRGSWGSKVLGLWISMGFPGP